MPDRIQRLISKMADSERDATRRSFLSPCVRGGRIQLRIANLVRSFDPRPFDFEGWGVFRAIDEQTAKLEEEANLPAIARYLELFTPLAAIVVKRLRGTSFLLYPFNESDAKQHGFEARPFVAHLVSEAAEFEIVRARFDGRAFWFEELDRRADPRIPELLRHALKDRVASVDLEHKGLTPEWRIAYAIASRGLLTREEIRRNRQEARLRRAVETGGGSLREYRDQGEYWLVDWTTSDGSFHTSAITKEDLTVMSAGICLEGRDRDFDLQSLVGVVEKADFDY